MNPVHTLPHDFSKTRFSIILPSTPRSSKLPFPFMFSGRKFVIIYTLKKSLKLFHKYSTRPFLRDHMSRFGNHWLTQIWVGFQVLTAASMKMAVFWIVAPWDLVEVYRRFRGACYLHHQGSSLKIVVFDLSQYCPPGKARVVCGEDQWLWKCAIDNSSWIIVSGPSISSVGQV
jgi:hypothetical protein